jgi:hypothetical protein
MNIVIDFKQAHPRRPAKKWHTATPQWWRLWFWPATLPQEDIRRLAPQELRRGGAWGPAVDRGRQSGADLRLI